MAKLKEIKDVDSLKNNQSQLKELKSDLKLAGFTWTG